MANPVRGEVEAVADGVVYNLVFDADALCTLEAALGKPVDRVVGAWWGPAGFDPARVDPPVVVALFWAALQRHHPAVGPAATGDLIKAIGEAASFAVLIAAVIQAYPPPATDEAPKPAPTADAAGTVDEPPGWDWPKLLGFWIELGLGSADAFWRSTPRALRIQFDAAARREERLFNQRAWLAWHTAALHRAQRLPKLSDLTTKGTVKPRRQTWQEMYAAAQTITAMAKAQAAATERRKAKRARGKTSGAQA